MKTLAFVSYKGGTGKSMISANVAAKTLQNKAKTALLDLDFSGPSMFTLFKKDEKRFYLNDYLYSNKPPLQVLTNTTIQEHPLTFSLADPSFEGIRKIEQASQDLHRKALVKLMNLKNMLQQEGFEYLILDTGPGISITSVNSLVLADYIFVICKPSESDIRGTSEFLKMLTTLKKTGNLILNRAVPSYGDKTKIEYDVPTEIDSIISDFQAQISTIVPCFCDLAFKTEKITLFPLEEPKHPFIINLEEILKITEN